MIQYTLTITLPDDYKPLMRELAGALKRMDESTLRYKPGNVAERPQVVFDFAEALPEGTKPQDIDMARKYYMATYPDYPTPAEFARCAERAIANRIAQERAEELRRRAQSDIAPKASGISPAQVANIAEEREAIRQRLGLNARAALDAITGNKQVVPEAALPTSA